VVVDVDVVDVLEELDELDDVVVARVVVGPDVVVVGGG
jgi:hypothetical protein